MRERNRHRERERKNDSSNGFLEERNDWGLLVRDNCAVAVFGYLVTMKPKSTIYFISILPSTFFHSTPNINPDRLKKLKKNIVRHNLHPPNTNSPLKPFHFPLILKPRATIHTPLARLSLSAPQFNPRYTIAPKETTTTTTTTTAHREGGVKTNFPNSDNVNGSLSL